MRFKTLAYGLPLVAIASAIPAQAQDETAARAEDNTDNTIVVTAQFREQRLQDTPLAITAVTAEMMEAKNQTDLSDLADTAPNVTLRPQGASFGPSVIAYIRGIGQYDFSPAYEPGVGIYIDDVYYPSLTGAMFDLLDLERVEILRGPQGTLAGRNSIGGAIKLYSRKPDGTADGFAEVSYGSRNKIALRAAAQFPIAENLSGRISGVYKSQDGYVDVLDFGCVNPPGSPLNDGTSSELPSGTFPVIDPLVAVNDSCKVGEMGDTNYGAVRGMLRYEAPGMDLDITLSGDYTRDSRSNAPEVLLDTVPTENPNMAIPMDDRFVCGRFCNYERIYLPAGTWYANTDPSAGTPWGLIYGSNGAPYGEVFGENKTTYEGYNFSSQISVGLTDAISIENIAGYGAYNSSFDTSGELSPATRGANLNELEHWHWSEELRLNIQPVEQVNLVLGGYYFEQETDYPSYINSRTFAGYPLEAFQDDNVTADSKALFANASWEIVPFLNLNAGIRYTKESKVYNYGRYDFDGSIDPFLDPVGAACGAGFSGVDTQDCDGDGDTSEVIRALTGNPAVYDGDNVDWRVALDYRFSDAVMVYGSISTGFKGGGTNPRPFNAYQAVSFGPEELTSYEIGLKSNLFANRVRFNLAGFIADYEDIQASVSLCPLIDGAPATAARTPCGARINAGDAQYRGIEAELFAEPIDYLTIDASMAVLDFEYKSLSPIASSVSMDDPARDAPEFKANIGMQYEAFLGGGAGSLVPRVDVDHTGEIYTGVTYSGVRTTIDDVTLVHASLTWRSEDEDLSVALRARNLTDEYYYNSVFDQRAASGYLKATVAAPREFTVTVKKRF